MLALLLHLAHDLAKGTYVSLTRAGPWALATWSRSSSSPTGLAVARVRTTSCSTSRPFSSKRRSVLLQQTCAWLWLALRWALWEALRHPLSKQCDHSLPADPTERPPRGFAALGAHGALVPQRAQHRPPEPSGCSRRPAVRTTISRASWRTTLSSMNCLPLRTPIEWLARGRDGCICSCERETCLDRAEAGGWG